MDMLKKLSIWLCCLTLSACATTPGGNGVANSSQQQLIARDLVGVLVQIEQLQPGSTTLSLPKGFSNEGGFAGVLMAQFEEAGYGIRTTAHASDDQPASYTLESAVDSAGRQIETYTINVGDFGVRRSYQELAGEGLKPVSLMNVKGADASSLRINDELFANQDGDSATAQSNTPSEPGNSGSQGAALARGSAVVIPDDLYRQPTRNFRDLEKSNFAELLSSHHIVDEAILQFSNDSVQLDNDNKRRIKQLVEQFDASSDVFSLIGCSNGSTRVEGGPRILAIGRGESVRQELLATGIPEPSVLYEACWSDEYYDEMMPRRGVVISLKRQAS